MSSEGFENVWNKTLEAIQQSEVAVQPTEDLEPLLLLMYEEACRRPVNEKSLQQTIEQLLNLFATEEGRSRDNCLVTSHFLMPGDEHWEEDWGDLPDRFVEILGIMSHELQQSVDDPEWSTTYGTTPEQLIMQLKTAPATGNN